MTERQTVLFVSAAKLGHACGLETPREWLVNYILHSAQFDIGEVRPGEMVGAYHQFFIDSSSCEGEENHWAKMSDAKFEEWACSYVREKLERVQTIANA